MKTTISPQFQEILTAWKNENYVSGPHEMDKELKGVKDMSFGSFNGNASS